MNRNIRIYTLSTCSHCKSTKKLLDENNVEYEFTDVDLLRGQERSDAIEDIKMINPECTFPTIIIGDAVIVGYKEDEIREALGL